MSGKVYVNLSANIVISPQSGPGCTSSGSLLSGSELVLPRALSPAVGRISISRSGSRFHRLMGLWSCRIQVCADAVIQKGTGGLARPGLVLASSLPSLVGPCRKILGSVLLSLLGTGITIVAGRTYGTVERDTHREREEGGGGNRPTRLDNLGLVPCW